MMDSIADDDYCSLAEEKFDFEVSLSPASSKGDDVEDEVFLGPITHKEKCISHGVDTQAKDSVSSGPSLGEEPSWSPLLEENFEEIRKEAHLLATHLERTFPEPVAKDFTAASSLPEDSEKFEMDTSAKLGMFKPVNKLSPIKRETFCVQDSPMKQLPSAIQKRLQKSCSISGGKPRVSTSSPLRTTDTQPKLVPRGKSLGPTSRILPNKPTTMGNSRLSSGTRTALPNKNRLPPPSKSCFGLKRSPGSRVTSRMGSAEDLLSDTASVASDVSDSSFNTSLPIKRGLPAPSKPELRGGAPLCKVPALTKRRVVDRSRNTSSSSSSVSSINSSLSVSPTGKLNSSLNTSVSSISGRIPSSSSRLPGSNRKSGIICKSRDSSAGRTASFSTQGRKGSEPVPRPVKATPIRKTDTGLSVHHQTPAKSTMKRTTSVPSISTLAVKTGSTVKMNFQLKASMAPTPTNILKGVQRSEVASSPDVPRIMKPKRLMSACSVDSSVPQRLALPIPHGLQTPSSAAEKPLQSKLRRPSALPTPVNRRVSGIPMLTPKSIPRLNKASWNPEAQSPGSSSEISHVSPGHLKQSDQQQVVKQEVPKEDSSAVTELQPCSLVFNLEDVVDGPTACEPAAVKSSKPSPVDPEFHLTNPEGPCPSHSEFKEILHNQLKKTITKEVLLVDAPAPVLKSEEKVLIDLSNTPDLIKTIPSKGFGGQLIDLSSPLIKWSPERKTENPVTEAPPLINLSF